MTDLEVYKKIQIDNLTKIYKLNCEKLKLILSNNIRLVNLSKIKSYNKVNVIKNLIKTYNNNINILTNTYNKSILNIQNYKPPIINNINKKKALLIGINYKGTDNELYGCINDIISIKEKLLTLGYLEQDIVVLTDDDNNNNNIKPTKANILKYFTDLLKNAKINELLYFYYSGHGGTVYDKNNDEITGYDQVIYPCDLNPIIDDQFKEIINKYLKKDVTLCSFFDSCFSGSVLDLKYQYLDTLNYNTFNENIKENETLGNVYMISGCTDTQTSSDAVFNNIANGAMTMSLLDTLKNNPILTWSELIKNMRNFLITNNFSQIPQISTGKLNSIDTKCFVFYS